MAHGFNAAVEVRYRRLIATYSHGQGLDYARFETDEERAAGASVKLPNGQTFFDPPAEQGYHGLLANILVGWAFDL